MKKNLKDRLITLLSINKCPECSNILRFYLEEIDEFGQYGTYYCTDCGYEKLGSY